MSTCRPPCPDSGHDADVLALLDRANTAAERTAAAAPLRAKALAAFVAKLIEGPMPAGEGPDQWRPPAAASQTPWSVEAAACRCPRSPNPKMGPDRTAALSSSEATTRSGQIELSKAGALPEPPRSRSLPCRLK